MHTPASNALEDLRHQLLDWYDAHARQLPWRVPPAEGKAGRRPDPYHVWLSEIMLQQTGVVTVKPYFEAFLIRYPRLGDLAAAPLDDVLGLWAGLGYYARARNLHAGAKGVASLGGFPTSLADLLMVKGIGPYTAAAVAAIAFDLPHVPVDGNVERVLSRLWLIEAALPAGKPVFRDAAAKLEETIRKRKRKSQSLCAMALLLCIKILAASWSDAGQMKVCWVACWRSRTFRGAIHLMNPLRASWTDFQRKQTGKRASLCATSSPILNCGCRSLRPVTPKSRTWLVIFIWH